MPSLGYLNAAKKPGSESVFLARIEDLAAQEEVITSKTDWDGCSLTSLSTALINGSVLPQKFFGLNNNGSILNFSYEGQTKNSSHYNDVYDSPTFDCFINNTVNNIQFCCAYANTIRTTNISDTAPLRGSLTADCKIQLRTAASGGGTLQASSSVVNLTFYDYQTYTFSTVAGDGVWDHHRITFYATNDVDLTVSPVYRRGSGQAVYAHPVITNISRGGSGFNEDNGAEGIRTGSSCTYEAVPEDAVNCTLTSSTVDLGSVPVSNVYFYFDDSRPSGSGISYTAFGSTDNFVSSNVNLGSVFDGGDKAPYRYYRVQADFTSTDGTRARLDEIRIATTEFRNYSTHKDQPLVGALPYLEADSFRQISSEIHLDKPTEVGDASFKMLWVKDTADLIATGYLKGKTVVLLHGYIGLGLDEYEEIFTGVWHDYKADPEKMTFQVTIHNVLKRFMKIQLPIETVDGSNNINTSSANTTWTAENLMQVLLDIFDEIGIPDRYINRTTIEGLRDGSFSGSNYNVTRTISKPVDAWKLMHELQTIAAIFLIPYPDGKLYPVVYDPTQPHVRRFDARKVKISSLDGGQKELFTVQVIYYNKTVSDPGDSRDDFNKAYILVNATSESNWDTKQEKRYFEKWSTNTTLIGELASNRDDWFSSPRVKFDIKDLPIHNIDINPGDIIQVENLLLPVPADLWPERSSLDCLVLSKTVDYAGSKIDLKVMQLGSVNEYYPDSITVDTGTGSGVVGNLQAVDQSYYQVAEVVGTPGYSVRLFFTGVIELPRKLFIYGRYDGLSSHNVKVSVYDYDAAGWVDLTAETTDLPASSEDDLYLFVLPEPVARFIDETNSDELIIKIEHTSAGNAAHDLYLDSVKLRA